MKAGWISHNKPHLDASDAQSIQSAVRSRWVAEGSVSRRFESEVASFLDQKYAKVTSTGTAALHLALLALQIKPQDEIIFSTYACTALLNSVNYVGAKPVLVDLDPAHLGPSTKEIRKKLTRKTRAVIVHHAFGFPSEIKQIKSLGVPVIEDCAQSLGTKIQGRSAGSFGDLAVCSFYATKMITAGYGGMILTNEKRLSERILDLTHFDQRRDYKVRYNYSLSDIAASIGLSQFKKLPRFLARRRQIARRYYEALARGPFYFWAGEKGNEPNYYRFPIGCLEPFQDLIPKFAKHKIEVISPIEPYQLMHRYLGMDVKKFPASEAIARSVVSLPIYPALTDSEVDRVCKALAAV